MTQRYLSRNADLEVALSGPLEKVSASSCCGDAPRTTRHQERRLLLIRGLRAAAWMAWVGVTLGAASCYPATDIASPSPATSERESPRAVADFTLETLDGNTVSLSDFAGKGVVLLVFWGSWCQACAAAMVQLNEVYGRHHDAGFELLGVSMDGPDTLAEVRAYVQRNGIDFPVLLDQESRAVSLYNPKRVAPFFVLLGKDNAIVSRRDGYQPGDESVIEEQIVGAIAR